MDEKNIPDPKEHAKDYLGDRMVMFMDKYYAVWVLASLLIPYLLFGWEGLIRTSTTPPGHPPREN